MRLTPHAALPPTVHRPRYDYAAQKCGIVHFGIGAFHRAHQAAYTDAAMNAGDTDWRIVGVSLRSANVADQMNPQHGLYTLSERSSDGVSVTLIGSVQRVVVASERPQEVIDAIALRETRIISFTITEKGYCRAADGSLDHELAGEGSIYPFLTSGLAQRKAAGLPGVTLLSCDNLAENGTQLATLLDTYLQVHDPALALWVREHCTSPLTMVDRIVPAATTTDRDALETTLGVRDDAAVMTEPFTQWVIEDNFAAGRPRWEVAGAQFTSDVRAFETAKLRMLNGAHSALAYLGLAREHNYVHEAIADPALETLINRLMRDEAATSLTPAPGQDLNAYADALITRFSNSALNHRLVQIAMDGSQKIPQRWLETLAHHQRDGRQCPAILTALAAWVGYIRGVSHAVDDPMAPQLAALWQSAGRDGITAELFGVKGLFAQYWQADAADINVLNRALAVPC